MREKLFHLALYPMIFVNVAIGFLMFGSSYQFLMILSDVVFRDNAITGDVLGPFSAIQRSTSIMGIIGMAVVALILFGLLDSYYGRVASNGGHLLNRFLFVIGIQLAYLGVVQLIPRLLIGSMFGMDTVLILSMIQIVIGVGLLAFTIIQRRARVDWSR
jgi:hypothetical protein